MKTKKPQQPALAEDYQRQIDVVANLPAAQELLKSVYDMAEFYFRYLKERGIYVSHITIANEATKNSSGPRIEKYITGDSLQRGGNLVSRH
jgi:hypothetical protein